MKYSNIRYTHYLLSVVSLLMLSSCAQWFDINPKTNVKAAKLFSSKNGFESALTGIYLTAGEKNAYGANWTFGFTDKLMGRYDNVPLPGSTGGAPGPGSLNEMLEARKNYFDYTQDVIGFNSKSQIASMWESSYNLIVNANNLLKWHEKNAASVFTHPQLRDRIKAEALAWRAFLHLDLLRAFGPIYSQNPQAVSIPYRLVATNEKLPLLPADEVAQLIIKDLKEAQELLSYEKENVFVSSSEFGAINVNRFRLNYWAVTAVLARVYDYIGDHEQALGYAKDVIDNSHLTLSGSNVNDPQFIEEQIFALEIYQMNQNYSSEFALEKIRADHYFCFRQSLDDIFERQGDGQHDMRGLDNAFADVESGNKFITRKYLQKLPLKGNRDLYSIPMVRLSEMYYIACANAPLDQSYEYLKPVLEARGVIPSPYHTDEERIKALSREYRKEFYAEGQYFYFAKKYGLESFLRSPSGKTLRTTDYIFPIPDDEKVSGAIKDVTTN